MNKIGKDMKKVHHFAALRKSNKIENIFPSFGNCFHITEKVDKVSLNVIAQVS